MEGLTTRGAVIGGFVGLISSLALTIVSPGVWEAVFGYPKGSALFPFVSPALFTMPLSFLCCWLFSVTDSSKTATTEQAAFEAQYVRSQTGIGADVGDRALRRNEARKSGRPASAGRSIFSPLLTRLARSAALSSVSDEALCHRVPVALQ